MNPFRVAVETRDFEGAVALLAEDVVFRSPVVFRPYHGRDAVGAILFAVSRVFEDFRYEREIGAEGARDHALVFKAQIGEREVHGCDFVHTDEDGLIDDFTVMVRPASRGIEPDERVTYPGKARKALYRDADGNEIGFGGAID